MSYQQGRCWRGSYFLLSTLSSRTAYAASKAAEFLELKGTRSSATSNSHPNPCTAYWIEQFSPCLPWTLWEHWAVGKMSWKQVFACGTVSDWDLHSLATRDTLAPTSVSVMVTLTFWRTVRSSSFSLWFPHPLHCSPRHRTKRCCLAGTLLYKLWSQSERLLLHLCTINCLLMGAKSICSNNLYSSSCAQLKAEPGVLSSAPESFLCQDQTKHLLMISHPSSSHPKEPSCRDLWESLLSPSHFSAQPPCPGLLPIQRLRNPPWHQQGNKEGSRGDHNLERGGQTKI